MEVINELETYLILHGWERCDEYDNNGMWKIQLKKGSKHIHIFYDETKK